MNLVTNYIIVLLKNNVIKIVCYFVTTLLCQGTLGLFNSHNTYVD